MTNSEARDIIFATAECEARQDKCDKNNCDECQLLYMQGTVKEHREALNMAIQALENQDTESVNGDLISRSLLLEELDKREYSREKHDFKIMIENQPTAYNDAWIPVSSGKLPEKLEPVNITWVNRKPEPYYAHIKDIPFVATAIYYNEKWWWFSCVCEDYLSEYGKSECDAVDKDIEVIAWQPLPQSYQPKGE